MRSCHCTSLGKNLANQRKHIERHIDQWISCVNSRAVNAAERRTGARQPRQLSVWNYGWKKRQAGGKGGHPSNIPLTLNDSMMNAWIGSIKLFFTREFICLPETISEVRAGASQLSVKPHSHIRTATACHRCCRQLRFGGASTSSHPKMMASVRRKRSSRELHGLLNFATMETAFSWVK